MKFDTFGLHHKVLAGVPAEYVSATPIQQRAIPALLAGRDLLGLAQTGTGKTAAFVLPILDRLIRERETVADGAKNFNHNRGHALRALILAPTRELAEQIADSVMTLGAKTGLRCTTIYGGVSMNPQIQRLRQGTDIVVACPGRLLDHMQQRTIDLRRVDMLVLDEADQMFDMGFLPGVRKIIQALPAKRQTLLFSATMPPDVRRLADDLLTNPESIQVGNHQPVSTVSHSIYVVDQARKSELLLCLLKEVGPGSVLVFTRTKYGASRLGLALSRHGYDATSLQGNMSQRQRQDALDGFRDGTFQVLVATDIAARGIDVQSVSHVINYDMPSTVEAYTHRIGRTGRAERTGDALTLVTRGDFSMLREIERRLGAPIARCQLPTEFLNPPAKDAQNVTASQNRPAAHHQTTDSAEPGAHRSPRRAEGAVGESESRGEAPRHSRGRDFRGGRSGGGKGGRGNGRSGGRTGGRNSGRGNGRGERRADGRGGNENGGGRTWRGHSERNGSAEGRERGQGGFAGTGAGNAGRPRDTANSGDTRASRGGHGAGDRPASRGPRSGPRKGPRNMTRSGSRNGSEDRAGNGSSSHAGRGRGPRKHGASADSRSPHGQGPRGQGRHGGRSRANHSQSNRGGFGGSHSNGASA